MDEESRRWAEAFLERSADAMKPGEDLWDWSAHHMPASQASIAPALAEEAPAGAARTKDGPPDDGPLKP
jgi:hypothetical protein